MDLIITSVYLEIGLNFTLKCETNKITLNEHLNGRTTFRRKLRKNRGFFFRLNINGMIRTL
jgi:hypothetical protein